MTHFPEIGAEKNCTRKPAPVSGASRMQSGTEFFLYRFQVIWYWFSAPIYGKCVIGIRNWSEKNGLFKILQARILCQNVVPLADKRVLKVNERIGYKLISLTYKVLTSSQPSYLNNLISVQPPRSTRSSPVVTLSRPPTISSLKITDRSFRYASPHLWNQLPDSFCQPRQSCIDFPPHSLVSSSLLSLPLSSAITPSLLHSRLKTYFLNKSFPPQTSFTYRTAFVTTGLDWTYHAHRFIFSFTF